MIAAGLQIAGLSRRSVRQHAKADTRVHRTVRAGDVALRQATLADVDAVYALIAEHVDGGHLLPRTREEIVAHASRFVIAVDRGSESPANRGLTPGLTPSRLLGCADIAPLSPSVGEIRSLVIGEDARGFGIGRLLMAQLIERATQSGFTTLCAFTSAPGFFTQSGFSIVPHTWLPEKIATNCRSCARFRACGQHGVMLSIARSAAR